MRNREGLDSILEDGGDTVVEFMGFGLLLTANFAKHIPHLDCTLGTGKWVRVSTIAEAVPSAIE